MHLRRNGHALRQTLLSQNGHAYASIRDSRLGAGSGVAYGLSAGYRSWGLQLLWWSESGPK
jgi:hypothetical protein